MKISLYSRHVGLIYLLQELWEGHSVRLDKHVRPPGHFGPHTLVQGDEDVHVSTIPHNDLHYEHGQRPVIAYITDPCLPEVLQRIDEIKDEPWFYPIGAEDCFQPQHYPPVRQFIPYACNPKVYPTYNGKKAEVLVVNKKASARLIECTQHLNDTGGFHPHQFLEGLPHTVAKVHSRRQLLQMYADYRVMFYFSNSPYTIVMFEGMTVGIPMVALNHHNVAKRRPIETYLSEYWDAREPILAKLREYLDSPPPPPVHYPMPNFYDVQELWESAFARFR